MAKYNDSQEKQEALRQLKADLKSGDYRTLYVFCGEEAYLREYYLRQLTQKLTGGVGDAFNQHRFNAENLSVEAFSDAVEAVPMMAERTFIRVDDVDLFKLGEHDREQMAAILSDLPDYCCVVFAYDTVEYKPNGQMRKLSDVMKKHACVVEFEKQSERDLCVWVTRHFKACGKDITDDVCRYLIFVTDGKMISMEQEIEKIASSTSASSITKPDIDSVVIPVLNAQTFDISNAIANGDFELAMRKMEELFAMQEDCGLILGAISSQIRRLHYARMITSCGKGQETLMEMTGMKSYPAGLTMTAARKVTDGFCRRAVELCLETDRKMKTSYDDPKRLLELLLMALAREVHSV